MNQNNIQLIPGYPLTQSRLYFIFLPEQSSYIFAEYIRICIIYLIHNMYPFFIQNILNSFDVFSLDSFGIIHSLCNRLLPKSKSANSFIFIIEGSNYCIQHSHFRLFIF